MIKLSVFGVLERVKRLIQLDCVKHAHLEHFHRLSFNLDRGLTFEENGVNPTPLELSGWTPWRVSS